MKTENKFAGTFLSDNIENNKRLFYAWNEFIPNMIIGSNSKLLGRYLRVKIKDSVYFITDNEAVEAFLNISHPSPFLKSKFFLTEDVDANEFSEQSLNKYYELIS